MSVLIKGMEMPKNCCECPLETDYGTCGYYSMFVEGSHNSDWKKRRDDCPLIELPAHGNLIDRSALLNKEVHSSNDYQFTVSDLLNAPVIIPHDGGEW